MTFHVLTLFPEMIQQAASHSILGRAAAAGIVKVNAVNIRDFAVNKHGQVDDAPYGGGAGMVMMAPPIFDAYEYVMREISQRKQAENGFESKQTPLSSVSGYAAPQVLYLSPQGRVLTQAKAQELSAEKDIILICGHYEGIDERVIEEIVTEEISIGDYVLTGGEPAALVLIDAVSRLITGVLGKEESHQNESFSTTQTESGAPLLEHPHYTRPPVFRGREVPEILLSGHHGKIAQWRHEKSVERTKTKRPDLIQTNHE
ncbi:MAG: tRNA (guanosine(37)-N1)-methyltransferase TrmD [Defluviitaleaceae bacterium]|nr:tRNA (guanosine(37)-N1)-methyltransferase TrmD [Defluviitaleaceae bacterium]MCL2262130.1 tRNA (guanosine(37)-N1)-methyltransferase TrmD [Defluviitaleaceae bacterium]